MLHYTACCWQVGKAGRQKRVELLKAEKSSQVHRTQPPKWKEQPDTWYAYVAWFALDSPSTSTESPCIGLSQPQANPNARAPHLERSRCWRLCSPTWMKTKAGQPCKAGKEQEAQRRLCRPWMWRTWRNKIKGTWPVGRERVGGLGQAAQDHRETQMCTGEAGTEKVQWTIALLAALWWSESTHSSHSLYNRLWQVLISSLCICSWVQSFSMLSPPLTKPLIKEPFDHGTGKDHSGAGLAFIRVILVLNSVLKYFCSTPGSFSVRILSHKAAIVWM